MILRYGCKTDSAGSDYDSVGGGSCKQVREISGHIKGEEYLLSYNTAEIVS
jgi:hypothetical protein